MYLICVSEQGLPEGQPGRVDTGTRSTWNSVRESRECTTGVLRKGVEGLQGKRGGAEGKQRGLLWSRKWQRLDPGLQ